ncbi:hypothetical protein [Lentibacter algarum]|uniref:hypothetical protein n=1 Tax=Lentibacter algarum TaxID=576131 RepID=UPI002304C9D6|nr:hypothetical protein [Lentibacter algarum]
MKIIHITACLAMFATAALADSDPKYNNPNVILHDLRELAATCAAMSDNQTNEEIFGITFSRVGNKCQYANGELDDNVRAFLEDQKLDWAGVSGHDGLWVIVDGN